jgi:hypothetical protein
LNRPWTDASSRNSSIDVMRSFHSCGISITAGTNSATSSTNVTSLPGARSQNTRVVTPKARKPPRE